MEESESSEEGRAVMKRIRVECGICKVTKYYSIHRGITRVASVVACESCRHFYQKLKRSPMQLDCNQPNKGSCYRDCSFVESKCKGCLAMQLLDCCPHPPKLYEELAILLSDECKNGIRGRPLEHDELGPDARGSLGFEVWKETGFVEVGEGEEFPYVIRDEDEEMEVDVEGLQEEEQREPSDVEKDTEDNAAMSDASKETETEEETVSIDERTKEDQEQYTQNRASKEKASFADNDQQEEDEDDEEEEEESSTPPDIEDLEDLDSGTDSLKISEVVSGDLDFDPEEEALVDDPPPLEELAKEKATRSIRLAAQNSYFGPRIKSSERIRQKAQKVEYFDKPSTGKKNKLPLYDSSGLLEKTGKDLCDCLQSECPGCHFPCPKCRSPKCGSECRVNRRWYFERIEVEGTKVFWTNKFVKF